MASDQLSGHDWVARLQGEISHCDLDFGVVTLFAKDTVDQGGFLSGLY
jgi:hypothetical protein